MAVHVAGLVAIIVFYVLIVVVGIWAAWYNRRKGAGTKTESIMIAGRDIGLFVGSFTMTATWVGGGYINGTAEYVYTPGSGLLWTQAPFGYSISLILGGIFFAKKMREQGYVTMLDPLQLKLGRVMGGLLYFPALLGELFWSAAILVALGGTLSIIAGLSENIAIIVSACIAVVYTIIGGMYSVAYTDVVQLLCILVGLVVSLPFAFTNEAVSSISETAYGNNTWLGVWDNNYAGNWIDSALLLIFGGIPWQVYFQRVLSANSSTNAQLLSFVAAAGCLIMSVPSILIGAVASSTNWTATSYHPLGLSPAENNQSALVLPIVLQHLCPVAVSFIGLGAVSAAVMSSADSSILSSSSMFTRNIYNQVFRRRASDRELVWVMRGAVLVLAAIATVLAIFIKSIYILFFLCSDLIFVMLFPQLLCVIYFDPNTYGSILAFVLGLILRVGGGEPLINFKPFIPYPGNTDTTANFPYKTFSMIITLITLLLVSEIAKQLFVRGVIPERFDVLKCNLANGGRSRKNKEKPAEDNGVGGEDNPGFELSSKM